jgi:ribose transport system permease protein
MSLTSDKSAILQPKPTRRRSLGAVPLEVLTVSTATVLLFVISYLLVPGTMAGTTLATMIPFAAMLAIVGVGQTLVIQQRGIDLSVYQLIVFIGLLVSKFGYDNLFVGVVVAVAAAAAIGFLNGFLVSVVSITPLVATLATSALLTALIRTVSGGFPAMTNTSLQAFSHADVGGVSIMVLVAIAVVVLASLMVRKTVVGRRFVAVGANAAAARVAGIPPLPYQIATYVAASVIFAITAILQAGFIGTAYVTAGTDYVLPSIAVVVIGGTPFTGGKGSVVATAIAALFVTQLSQLVLALGAATSMQLMVQAFAIVVATSLRRLFFGRAK